jgi:hypothetical protein
MRNSNKLNSGKRQNGKLGNEKLNKSNKKLMEKHYQHTRSNRSKNIRTCPGMVAHICNPKGGKDRSWV